MNPVTRVQLSIMMFLQFFVWGVWYVTAPNYLSTIGFIGNDFGWTYSVGPIAGMISPFFVGMIADRFFPAQRVLGVLHLLGAAAMYGATQMMQTHSSPNLINLVFFGYMLTYFPTLSLTSTLAMKNMSNPEKEFPLIRVFGTLGWIAAGSLLSFLTWDNKIEMFYLASGAALFLGLFSFALPHTPPSGTGPVSTRELLGLDALVLLKDRSYLTFMVSSVLICIPLACYYQIASRVVEMVGLPVGLTMSYGQWSETIFMLAIPLCFSRLGVKWMLAVGMLAWVVRYALFAIGAPAMSVPMVVLGIVLHGICYDFFFVTGQIYTDQMAPSHLRGQAQGLLVLFTLGIGMLIGAQAAGAIETHCTPPKFTELGAEVAAKDKVVKEFQATLPKDAERTDAQRAELKKLESSRDATRVAQLQTVDWRTLWGIPAIFAGAILFLFVVLFRAPPRVQPGVVEVGM